MQLSKPSLPLSFLSLRPSLLGNPTLRVCTQLKSTVCVAVSEAITVEAKQLGAAAPSFPPPPPFFISPSPSFCPIFPWFSLSLGSENCVFHAWLGVFCLKYLTQLRFDFFFFLLNFSITAETFSMSSCRTPLLPWPWSSSTSIKSSIHCCSVLTSSRCGSSHTEIVSQSIFVAHSTCSTFVASCCNQVQFFF